MRLIISSSTLFYYLTAPHQKNARPPLSAKNITNVDILSPPDLIRSSHMDLEHPLSMYSNAAQFIAKKSRDDRGPGNPSVCSKPGMTNYSPPVKDTMLNKTSQKQQVVSIELRQNFCPRLPVPASQTRTIPEEKKSLNSTNQPNENDDCVVPDGGIKTILRSPISKGKEISGDCIRRFKRWTLLEDMLLVDAVKHGCGPPHDWKKIATHYFNGSRSSQQVRPRCC